MPITLAHPAAVLPLKRFCPRWLCFPGLVAGSICPDVWYLGKDLNLDLIAHRLGGVWVLDLGAGLVLLALFYGLRSQAVQWLPPSCRAALEPLCRVPICTNTSAVVSVLLGILSHLLLDGMTHKDGWLIEWLPFLQTPLWSAGYRAFRVYHLLWYIGSFIGVMWVYLAFEEWRQRLKTVPANRETQYLKAALVAALLIPFELIHHVIHARSVSVLAGGITAVVLALFLKRDCRRYQD